MSFFSVCSEINRNSIGIGPLFDKAIANHYDFLLTEVTVFRRISIVNKCVKIVCEVSFWYTANYSIIGVLATPARTINEIRLNS